MKKLLLILFFAGVFVNSKGQEAYRFHSDFLFRAKGMDSLFRVTKGEVFYDKNIKTLVFNNTFPRKERYVLKDTTMYLFSNDSLIRKQRNLIPPEHTMSSYLLSSTFSNYGLDKAGFNISNVEKKKGIVVTSWIPNGAIGQFVGKILIANKNKQLYSVVIYDKDMKLITRQIFKKYQDIEGTQVPSEILSVTYYGDTSKYVQITNLSNIKLNETINNEFYDYKVD